MQITVSGRQVIVTPALRDYAETKIGRIARHFDHLHEVSVVLFIERFFQKAEATLHCAANKTIHADASGEDLYAAIDGLVDKLDRQARKHKEKLTDHRRTHVREARYAAQ